MSLLRWGLTALTVVSLAACSTAQLRTEPPAQPAVVGAPAHDNLNATLWIQSAAEYEGSVRSVFNAARHALDEALEDPSWIALPHGESSAGFESKPPAIIADADETLIANSAFQARGVIEDRGYTHESWVEWVNAQAARAIPGAVEFAQYADSRGVTIFYVTNRDAPDEYEATVANLRQLGFPVAADASNVLLRGDARAPAREKGERRRWIDRNYRVVQMFGDNLGDFLDGINSDVATRQALIAPYADWWGRRWFMLPNPTYGSWYNAVLRSCETDSDPRSCVRSSLRHDY
ncbi:MAG: acid phosphatase [Gammaproteobacteria bacterium]|nr:acid phosphatase [Gammaproteobacteria bacterium]